MSTAQPSIKKSDNINEISHRMREYLQSAFRLAEEGETITVTGLAQARKVAPASATAMVKKLTQLDLMIHDHYGSIELTDEGRRQALLTVRRHRLLECFLLRVMHFGMGEIHDESHRLEAAISDAFEVKMDEILGFPKACPHGDPIPDVNGIFPSVDEGYALTELPEGTSAIIQRVPGSKKELLTYLLELGLEPEQKIRLVRRDPFGGPLHLEIGGKPTLIGPEAAQTVFVTPLAED